MADDTHDLAAGFPAPDETAWLARAKKALGGAVPDEALTWRGPDGLEIRPLYRRGDLPQGHDPSGFPGFDPVLRGSRADGRSWEIRQRHVHPDPAEANRQILKDLERGVAALTLGIDPEGRCGTVVRSKADLAEALEGVDLSLAPVVLEAGRYGPALAAMLLALWEERGVAAEAARGALGLDPLGALAAEGRLASDVESALGALGALARWLDEGYPHVSTAMVATRVYHSAGASEAQELGAMLATAAAYLRAMEQAGVAPEQAAGRIAFTLAADVDLMPTIAKFRAARALWARMLTACSVEALPPMSPAAETAPRMLARRDPWTNLLRTTLAAFAATAGGAPAVTVFPHDAACGVPSDFARRVARNVQIILAEESHLGRVMDPAGGAYAFEALTRELAERGWAEFQRIEAEGGMAASLAAGALQARIAEAWARRADAIARREAPVIGVSEYPDLGEASVETGPADPAAAIAKAKARAGLAQPSGRGWPALIDAAREDAAIERLAGNEGTPASAAALPAHRLGEAFEALRDRSDAVLAEAGARPRIYLACLGRLAEYTARASWAENLYAAGGIEAVIGSGGTDLPAIADEFRNSGAGEAAICGPDALYEEHVPTLAAALREVGARHLALVGKAGEQEAAWRKAGVESFAYMGIDCIAFLEAMYDRLGERQ